MGLQILETSKHSIRITCDRIDGVANLNWESQQKKGVIDEADSRSSLKRLRKRRSNHNRLALFLSIPRMFCFIISSWVLVLGER